MSDREKVVEKLGRVSYYFKSLLAVGWRGDADIYREHMESVNMALALLKEQEPIKPTLSVDTWICSKCGHTLESQELIDDKENPQVLVHEQYEYCPCCGRKVKWDG